MSKTKIKTYPKGIVTDAAKRLYDEGLIPGEDVVKLEADAKKQLLKENAKKLVIKGYEFNSHSNRRERRAAAKRGGYLPKDWRMYRTTNTHSTESRQTLVKEAA